MINSSNSEQIYNFEISSEEHVKIRIDKFLMIEFEKLNILTSRSKIQKIIEAGLLFNKDKLLSDNSYSTKLGDKFTITLKNNIDQEEQKLIAKKIDFETVFEDQYLAVINKPAGLTTHPGAGNIDNTLANGLLYKFQNSLSNENGDHRPGIVHRLDKDTSGLMVIAKDNESHMLLSKAIQDKEIVRKYLTFIYGTIEPKSGRIEKEISRNKHNRLKMTTSRQGTKYRNATTLYNVTEVFHDGFASMVECQLQTGRTHQIRVHLESIKHSVIGDQLYNSCKKTPPKDFDPERLAFINSFSRQALHSYFIEFTHPITKELLSFTKELPRDMQELRDSLR